MFWLTLALILSVALAWHRASLQTATAAFAGLLLLYGVFGGSLFGFGLCLLLFLGVLLPLNAPALREEWLSRPALDHVQRRLLPAAMLGAPEPAWVGELLADLPDLRRLRALQAQPLSAQEQAFLDGPVETLAALCSRHRGLAEPVRRFVVEQRMAGLSIATEYGGLGLSAQAAAAVFHKLASAPGAYAVAALIGATEGAARLVQRHGSESQKSRLLPRLVDGSEVLCLAHAATWAGESAADLPDRAVVGRGVWKGKESLGLLLDFDKTVAMPGAMATLIAVSLRLRDPEGLLPPSMNLADDTLAVALVPMEAAGLQLGRADPGSDSGVALVSVTARGLFVPLEFLVPGGAGGLLADSYALARGPLLAALAAGDAALATHDTAVRTRLLQHYGLSASSATPAHRPLAAMAAQAYALTALQRLLAAAAQSPEDASPAVSAIGGLQAARLMGAVQQQRLQTQRSALAFGRRESRRRLRVAMLAAPLAEYDGLAFALSRQESLALAVRGRWRHLFDAAAEPNPAVALKRFDAVFWALCGDLVAGGTRAWLLGLSRGWLALLAGEHLARAQHRRYARYAAAVALARDAWLATRHRQSAQAAMEADLANASAQLVGLAAALLNFEAEGRPRSDLPLLDAVCARAACAIEDALESFLAQWRSRLGAALLRVLLFPLGRHATTPDDARERSLAAMLHSPGELRDRLLRGLWRAGDPAAPSSLPWRLEQSLQASAAAQRRLRRLREDGVIESQSPLEQIGEAARKGLIQPEDVEVLRQTYNLAEDLLRPRSRDEPPRLRRRR